MSDLLVAKVKIRNISISIGLTVVLVLLDQWLKILAKKHLLGSPGFSYWSNFIRVEYAENRGAFLSFGANLSEELRFWIFIVGVFFILGFCLVSMAKSIGHTLSVLAFSLVISGGIGNLIDRVMQGYVVDYIHMGFSGWFRTGVFNLADVAISGGLIILLILQYKVPTEKES